MGEHLQPLRSDEPVRRLQGVRLRPRGRPARARSVSQRRRVVRVEVRRAREDDADELTALDRATWTALSSPAPLPNASWTFFNEKTKPEDVLVALLDGD